MDISWLSIVLPIIVFVVGAVVCIRLSKGIAQKAASLIALAALLILWILFLIVVVILKLQGATIVLAIACVVIPIVLYFILLHVFAEKDEGGKKIIAEEEKLSDKVQALKESISHEDKIKEPTAAEHSARLQEPAPRTISDLPRMTDFTPVEDYQLRPDEDLAADSAKTRTTKETEEMYRELRDSVIPDIGTSKSETSFVQTAYDHETVPEQEHPALQEEVPAVESAPALEMLPAEEELAAAQQPAMAVESSLEMQEEPAHQETVLSDTAPAPDVIATDAAAITAEIPVVKDTAEVQEDQSSNVVNFDSCYRKAEVYAEKGIWPFAAVLFEEGYKQATQPQEEQKALFAAMSAYLKAEKPVEVQRLIDQLEGEVDLSPAQNMKLTAIKQMLK